MRMGKEDDDDNTLVAVSDDDASMKSSLKSSFEGDLRVNVHDPSEAYVSVSFLPVDVKFRFFFRGGRDQHKNGSNRIVFLFTVGFSQHRYGEQ